MKTLFRCALACFLAALSAGRGWAQAGPATERDFIVAYSQAHDRKDVAALMKLVYWAGVEEDLRGAVERSFAANVLFKPAAVLIEPLGPGEMTEYARGGVTYRPNLKPVGKLTVKFEKSADGPTATGYLVGINEGVYFITTAAPVLQKAAAPVLQKVAAPVLQKAAAPVALKAAAPVPPAPGSPPPSKPAKAAQKMPSGAATDDELVKAFRLAHQAKDADAILKLIHWKGVPEHMRDFTRNAVTANFANTLLGVEIHPLTGRERLEVSQDGVVHKPTLSVAASVVVVYGSKPSAPALLPELFIGAEGKRRYFVMRAP